MKITHLYGAKFVPIFIKQIQRFANKHNLLCKKLYFQTNANWFAIAKLYLRENAEVWTNMYCVLQLWDSFAFLWPNVTWFSHKCVQADFLTCVQTDFLTNACRQIFSHVFKLIFSQMRAGRFSHMCSNWFSHKCNPNSRRRCWSIYAKHLFTFSRNTAEQHEWGTGEFLSYYFYN